MIVETILGIGIIYFIGRALGYEVKKKSQTSEGISDKQKEYRRQYYLKNKHIWNKSKRKVGRPKLAKRGRPAKNKRADMLRKKREYMRAYRKKNGR